VQGQDLNQLRQTLPQIGEAMKKAFGTTSAEGLKSLGITSKEFIATITNEFAKLPSVTGGLKNSLENLSDAGTLALSHLGASLSKSLNLEALSDSIGAAVKHLVDAFEGLSPGVQKGIFVFAGLVAAIGPVLVAVGAVVAVIPALIAGLAVLSAPIGIIVAGVAALTAGLVYLAASGTNTTASFQKQKESVKSLTDSVNPLLSRYDELKSKTALTGAEQKELGSIVQKVGEQVPTAITAFDSYGKALNINSAAAKEFVSQQQAILAVKNKDALTEQRAEYSRLSAQIAGATNALSDFDKQGRLVKAVFDESGGGFQVLNAKEIAELQAKLASLSEARKGVGGLIDELKGIAPAVKGGTDATDANSAANKKNTLTLKELQEQLKSALAARFADAQAGQSTTADDTNIARIRALIAEYKQAPSAAASASTAFADVQKSLRAVGQESLALGDQYDYLKARQSATESGIKKLVGAGFSPASMAVQKLVADLRNLNTTLGDNTLLSGRKVEGSDKLFKTPDFKLKTPDLGKPPEMVLPNYQAMFGRAAQEISTGNGALKAAFKPVKQSQLDFNTQIEQLTDQLGASIGPLVANLAGDLGAAFGQIVSGTASAGDALSGALGGILTKLAGFMGDFGKQLITIGIGKVALDSLFTGPQGGVLAIAAGVGLVALAGIASAVGKSAASNLGSISNGGSGGHSLASAPSTPTAPAAKPTPAPAPITIIHEVRMVQRGADLTGAIQIQQTRTGRVLGGKVH